MWYFMLNLGSCYNYRRIAGICDSVWQWRQENILVSTAAFFTQACRLFILPHLQ
jgi:hypothetical protein